MHYEILRTFQFDPNFTSFYSPLWEVGVFTLRKFRYFCGMGGTVKNIDKEDY